MPLGEKQGVNKGRDSVLTDIQRFLLLNVTNNILEVEETRSHGVESSGQIMLWEPSAGRF